MKFYNLAVLVVVLTTNSVHAQDTDCATSVGSAATAEWDRAIAPLISACQTSFDEQLRSFVRSINGGATREIVSNARGALDGDLSSESQRTHVSDLITLLNTRVGLPARTPGRLSFSFSCDRAGVYSTCVRPVMYCDIPPQTFRINDQEFRARVTYNVINTSMTFNRRARFSAGRTSLIRSLGSSITMAPRSVGETRVRPGVGNFSSRDTFRDAMVTHFCERDGAPADWYQPISPSAESASE